jgi:hypothetical protein
VHRWQVATNLIYGQVKKSYQRRKLVRVTHVMRLLTEAALKASLQGMGFSGRLNTAFIERVNLTVRHGVSALARRVVFPVIITCSFLHIVTKQSSSIPQELFKSLESRWKKLGERAGERKTPKSAVQKARQS